MSEAHRKPPPLTFLVITITALVILGYPLSVGPAAWVAGNSWCPPWLEHSLEVAYFPLEWLAENSPAWLREAIYGYAEWWIRNPVPPAGSSR
jgi:hypothetical protein